MAGHSISDEIDIIVYINDEPSEITLSGESRKVRHLRRQMIESGYPNMERAIFKKHDGNQRVRIDDPKNINNGDKIDVKFAAEPRVAPNSQFPTQSFTDVCCANGKLNIGGSAVVGTDGANKGNQIFERVIKGNEVEVKKDVTICGKVVKKPNNDGF